MLEVEVVAGRIGIWNYEGAAGVTERNMCLASKSQEGDDTK